MNDAVFIQAIRDEPHDDLPRLVYADYLEDEGQSQRGELIRIQCELSRGVSKRSRALELLARMRELVVLHEIAHHLSPTEPAHGPDFVATFCELAGAVMGPEVGHVLRVVYAKEGVR